MRRVIDLGGIGLGDTLRRSGTSFIPLCLIMERENTNKSTGSALYYLIGLKVYKITSSLCIIFL